MPIIRSNSMRSILILAFFALPMIAFGAEIVIGSPEESGCAPIGIG